MTDVEKFTKATNLRLIFTERYVQIDHYYFFYYDKFWKDTEEQINKYLEKASVKYHNNLERQLEYFNEAMISRLNRLKNIEKIYVTMAKLVQIGNVELAEKYYSKILMNEFI